MYIHLNDGANIWKKNINRTKIRWVVWVIQNTKNQILFVIEWENKSWKKEWQIFIPGGSVEDGESIQTAVIREIIEETQIEEKLFKNNCLSIETKWTVNLIDEKYDIDVIVFLIKTHLQEIASNNNWEIQWTYFDSLQSILNKSKAHIRPGLYECIFTALKSTNPNFIYPSKVDIEKWEYKITQFCLMNNLLKQLIKC